MGPRPPLPIALDRLNDLAAARACVSGRGERLRFVAAGEKPGSASSYERDIFESGCVSTRTEGPGALHDFFNALSWLTLPRLKARLNAMHAGELGEQPRLGERGWLRDRATLFDESGALLLTEDDAIIDALRGFDWPGLFVHGRARFSSGARVIICGHAVQEKLCRPYKALCAQVLVLKRPVTLSMDEIDHEAARALERDALARLNPCPVLGIPGWWSQNEDPTFYNDPDVFRRGRRS
jgi:hypothetical protein